DHVGGWPGVHRGRRIDAVVGGPTSPALTQVFTGQQLTVGRVELEVVWPSQGLHPAGKDGSTVNDASVVLRVRVDGVSLLLTGDVEPDAQEIILRSGMPLAADVLKVPHHDSARQSERFFAAVGA